jgi:hypothetical protein
VYGCGGYYGYGVYGLATTSSGYGVCGYSTGTGCSGILAPAYYMLYRYIGVYGYNAQGYGAGLYGYSSGTYSYGVYGHSSSGYSYGVYGYAAGYPGCGVYGYAGSSAYAGVLGYAAAGWGVLGYGYPAGGYFLNTAGYYAYVAYLSYGILSNGTKSCVIATSQGDRAMYCPEAPEVLFEDVGSARLANGYCRVDLDPLMLEGCTIDDEHPLRVFVTTKGPSDGVYVRTGDAYFEVFENGSGRSSVALDWRIVASRKGFEDKRLEPVDVASATAAPAPAPAPSGQ